MLPPISLRTLFDANSSVMSLLCRIFGDGGIDSQQYVDKQRLTLHYTCPILSGDKPSILVRYSRSLIRIEPWNMIATATEGQSFHLYPQGYSWQMRATVPRETGFRSSRLVLDPSETKPYRDNMNLIWWTWSRFVDRESFVLDSPNSDISNVDILQPTGGAKAKVVVQHRRRTQNWVGPSEVRACSYA